MRTLAERADHTDELVLAILENNALFAKFLEEFFIYGAFGAQSLGYFVGEEIWTGDLPLELDLARVNWPLAAQRLNHACRGENKQAAPKIFGEMESVLCLP